jgi:hypothetical protein
VSNEEDSSRGSRKGDSREGQVMKIPVEGQAKKTPEGQVMKTSVEGQVKKLAAFLSGKTPNNINPVTV